MSSRRDKSVVPLPVVGERNILVTSALPYVNNIPHLGNIIGCVLSADVYARYCRLRGYNTVYVCGTDEYGTATETKALQEGVTPQEICDKYHAIHAQVYRWFNIDFDVFGRTSTPLQTDIVQSIFRNVDDNGIVLEEDVEQLFCSDCDKFLADRFVSGTCPECGYEDARGDQCDGCGQLMNATSLIRPKCSFSGHRTPIVRSSRHLFLDLPILTDRLTDWIDTASVKGFWSNNSLQLTRAWLKTGLTTRSITRDLKWGIPVPKDGFRDKVFYVWFDAPIGYLSITAALTPSWESWWKNPEHVELVQFMGKDNVPFHTVIFPCTLIGADQGFTMLHHISTTEYLNYESGKFSKSRGVGVFGDSVQETGVASYTWRYYLLSNRPESSDTVFTWDDFQSRNNNELLKNLGNFVNRALVFVKKFFDGIVPPMDLNDDDRQFVAEINDKTRRYVDELEKVQIRDGLRTAMGVSHLCNAYFQHNEPWKLVKEGQVERAGTVIALGVQAVVHLATLLEPYMPSLTDRVLEQTRLDRSCISLRETDDGNLFRFTIAAGHAIGEPQVLFNPIKDDDVALWRKSFGGQAAATDEDAIVQVEFPLNLVTGEIVAVAEHDSADHLYVLQVNVGSATRQIVSGLREQYTIDELLGKKVVVVANLKASTFRGARSLGMILCASNPDTNQLGLLLSPGAPGDQVRPQGTTVLTGIVDAKKGFAKIAPELTVDAQGRCLFRGTFPFVVGDRDPVAVDRVAGPAVIR